jgi:serine/threonine protein phosphatase PrpC
MAVPSELDLEVAYERENARRITASPPPTDQLPIWDPPPFLRNEPVMLIRHTFRSWTGNFLFRSGWQCAPPPHCMASFANSQPQSFKHSWISTVRNRKDRRRPNQDRGILVQSLADTERSQVMMFAALFDGHGSGRGHDSAERALVDVALPLLLQQDALPFSHEHIIRQQLLMADTGPIQAILEAGTTCVLAWQMTSDRLVLASVGDSTALLVRFNSEDMSTTVIAQAVKHKPSDPGERARIMGLGGSIWMPKKPTSGSYVEYAVADGNTHYLAMTRSLGDSEGKRFGNIIAEPSLVVVESLSQHLSAAPDDDFLFVVVASDGLTDVISLETVTTVLGKALQQQQDQQQDQQHEPPPSSSVLGTAVDALTQKAAARWKKGYQDDITLIVARLMVG